jgi:osmoprotectant transport system substrate-binding protein
VNRASVLALLAAAPLAGCGLDHDTTKIGSKNFTESLLLGELYAQLLENGGLHVRRRLDLGGTEYTGTALLVVLKAGLRGDPAQTFAYVKQQYAARYGLTWLAPAPMNNTEALATTAAVAERYGLRTLSDLAVQAPQLRLGAVPEFVSRPDGLPGLKRVYGGFAFKEVRLVDFGLKYKALIDGDVDIVVAFGTDGAILADHLVVMRDDKQLFPPYNVAPVVRTATLAARPGIATILNRVAPLLTDPVMQGLNEQIDGPAKQEPADVAAAFIKQHGLGG